MSDLGLKPPYGNTWAYQVDASAKFTVTGSNASVTSVRWPLGSSSIVRTGTGAYQLISDQRFFETIRIIGSVDAGTLVCTAKDVTPAGASYTTGSLLFTDGDDATDIAVDSTVYVDWQFNSGIQPFGSPSGKAE